MKTTGLTLEETLRALVDGKASGSKYSDLDFTLHYDTVSGSFYTIDSKMNRVFSLYKDLLRPEWSLVDPVQEYEEVERVRWDIFGADGSHLRTNYKTEDIAKKAAVDFPGSRLVKMTGIDRVPKTGKVTRRVEVKSMIDGAGYVETSFNNFEEFVEFPETHGKTGRLIFEWEE